MAKADTTLKWLIPILSLFALSLITVGGMATSNAASFESHKEAQRTQLQDLKERLIRIEDKVDNLKAR